MIKCSNCKQRPVFIAQHRVVFSNAAPLPHLLPPECDTCHGTGEVTTEHAERIVEGEQLRRDRVSRGVSLREEAVRLGVTPRELNDREFGRG